MPTPESSIRSGTIICAQITHPSGRGRDIARFYLVISPTDENKNSVVCLGISRQCPEPPPDHAILLPFNPEPRSKPMTGLRQRCAVFVDWNVEIAVDEIIQSRIGYVTQKLFDQIMSRFDKHNKHNEE